MKIISSLIKERSIPKPVAVVVFAFGVLSVILMNGFFFSASAEEDENEARASSNAPRQEIIEELQGIAPLLTQIKGVIYQWNTDNDDVRRYGFVPSEVEDVLPELVTTFNDGSQSVNNADMVPYIVATLSELEDRIAAIEERVRIQPERIERNEAVIPVTENEDDESESGEESTEETNNEGEDSSSSETPAEVAEDDSIETESATEEESAPAEENVEEEEESVVEEESEPTEESESAPSVEA